MLKKIIVVLIIIIAVFVTIVALQPSEYRLTRSLDISAPPDAIFAQVNDFHKWNDWSPWAKLDPDAKYTYEGASSGTGAINTWTGNDKVGQGSMTILESHTNDSIHIKLEFIKPFPAVCATDFTFKPQGNQTAVMWTMTGTNNFMGKAFCLFMSMEKTVGPDFEKGLAQMKAVAESAAKK